MPVPSSPLESHSGPADAGNKSVTLRADLSTGFFQPRFLYLG